MPVVDRAFALFLFFLIAMTAKECMRLMLE